MRTKILFSSTFAPGTVMMTTTWTGLGGTCLSRAMCTSARAAALQVGFIGLGNMGSAMAQNLIKSGVHLTVYDISERRLSEFETLGAEVADSPAGVAGRDGMHALVTMLPSDESVWQTYTGVNGILDSGSSCPLYIDCSTISPTRTLQLAEMVAAQQPHRHGYTADIGQAETCFVDAPVSGGVPAAKAGTLTFLCGGNDAAVGKARHVLARMGRRVVHTGAVGSGQSAKICNNLVLGISMAAVSEGLALGAELGLDPRILSDVFNASSARCWASDSYNPAPGVMQGAPASNGYQAGFANKLMVKDLTLAQEAARAHGMGLPLCHTTNLLYRKAMEEMGDDKDFSSIYKLYERMARGDGQLDEEALANH